MIRFEARERATDPRIRRRRPLRPSRVALALAAVPLAAAGAPDRNGASP